MAKKLRPPDQRSSAWPSVYMALLVSNSLKSIIKSNDINKEILVDQSIMMYHTDNNKPHYHTIDCIVWVGIGVAVATVKVGGPNYVRLNGEKSSRSSAKIHCDRGEIAILLGDNIKFKVIMS